MIVLLISIVISLILLNFLLNFENNKDFLQIAINEETTIKYSEKINEKEIHCGVPGESICLKDYNNLKNNLALAVLFGNSQLHSINQYDVNDNVASYIAHLNLLDSNKYLITFSNPNVSLVEIYVMFEYLLTKVDIHSLMIQIVFDDMREVNLRSKIKDLINNDVKNQLLQNKFGQKIIIDNINLNDNDKKNEYSLSLIVEEELNEFLLNKSLLWRDRGQLRAKIFNFLYVSRNSLFNIDSSSVRKLIIPKYNKNIEALNQIMIKSKKNDINLSIYIAPIRDDFKIPYDFDEYKMFKSSIQNLSLKYDIKFYDFEKIVPNKHWGYGNSINISNDKEVDFMHFNANGHKIISKEIIKVLEE